MNKEENTQKPKEPETTRDGGERKKIIPKPHEVPQYPYTPSGHFGDTKRGERHTTKKPPNN